MTRRLKTCYASRCAESELGVKYELDDTYTVYDNNVRVVDKESGRTLGILLKGILKKEKALIEAGRRLITYRATSVRRADASGERKSFYSTGGQKDKMIHHGASVVSSIVGYADADNYHPCRQTALYRKHRELFDTDTIHLIRRISQLFKEYCPQEYALQKGFIDECNQNLVLNDTVYTTLTVNVDWQTATHRDKGDFHAGLGNLSVFKYGGNDLQYTGGELMLPEFKVAFNMEEGDVLFMDVHEVHCNNTIQGKGRVSLICYAREQIKARCDGVTKEQLENPLPHKLRPKRPTGKCINCDAKSTCQWRYTKENQPLCNSCGIQYRMAGYKLVPPKKIKSVRKKSVKAK